MRRWAAVSLGVIIGLAAGLIGWRLLISNAENPPDPLLLYDDYPVWSPDGQSIAFVSGRSGSQNIWRMDTTGAQLQQLTRTQIGGYYDLAWSPDGQQIAYSYFDGADQANVWIMAQDGSQSLQISQNPAYSSAGAHWSPDSQQLAYASIRPEQQASDIWIVNADGRDAQVITSDENLFFLTPIWSQDGSQIAFLQDADQEMNLWLWDVVANQLSTLTTRLRIYGMSWSPDNRQLVFFKDYIPTGIWAYHIAENDLDPLIIDRQIQSANPQVSADGQYIYYEVLDYTGKVSLWRMDIDGSNRVKLTPSLDQHPFRGGARWSPDASQVLFVSDFAADQNTDIWIMKADGTDPRNLTGK